MTLFGLMVRFQGMLFLTDITFQLTACIFGLHNTFLTPSFIFLLRKFIYHIQATVLIIIYLVHCK